MPETIRDAHARVATRDDDAPPKTIEQIKDDLRKSKSWFDSVAPRHIDADQFVSLCLGVIRKGDRFLQMALVQAPHTFMYAASECARLGLVPGETYHFVAFKNTKEQIYEVTGIVDYKGEIDQIYRAGGVTAVHCHTVRANDTFIWRPGQMDLPHHRIPQNDYGQEGLGSYDDRGPLTGVYAYATMAGGGYSQPVVMGLSEIARHRSFAKTEKFWGPAWPGEGPHTVDMWRKTAIHRLFDIVPHSAEYLAERLRAGATLERTAMPDAMRKAIEAVDAADAAERNAVDGEVIEEQEPGAVEARSTVDRTEFAGAAEHPLDGAESNEDPGSAPPVDESMARIAAVFREYGFGQKVHGEIRRAVVTGLLHSDPENPPTGYVDSAKLTPAAAAAAAEAVARFCDGLADDPDLGTVKEQINAFAARVIMDITEQRKEAH